MLENERNAASLLGAGGFDAQWNDDFHNSAHVLLTGERDGYYRAYADAPRRHLARIARRRLRIPGEPSPHTAPARRTERTCRRPRSSRSCRTTGNRAFGERLRTLANEDAVRAATALLLLAPSIPLLFMGEEDGSTQPFQFFTDYRGALADAVREAGAANSRPFRRSPTPRIATRFRIRTTSRRSCVRRCTAAATKPRPTPTPGGAYRSALTVRAALVTPNLPGASALGVDLLAGDGDPQALAARWRLGDGSTLTIALNLGSHDAVLPALPVGKIVFETPPRAHATGCATCGCRPRASRGVTARSTTMRGSTA